MLLRILSAPFAIATILYSGGLLLGHTGTLIQTTAQSWLLFQLTNSPFYLGLEGLCLGLPRVLFSALGGAIVDRADRKIIFVVTQIAFLLMTLSRCNELFGDDPSLV